MAGWRAPGGCWPTSPRARTWLAAGARMLGHDGERARPRPDRASARARDRGRPRLRRPRPRASGIGFEGLALVDAGRVEDGMARLDEAAAAATAGELDEPLWSLVVFCNLIFACARVRDFARAAEWCATMRDEADRMRHTGSQGICRAHYGAVLTQAATGRGPRTRWPRRCAVSTPAGRPTGPRRWPISPSCAAARAGWARRANCSTRPPARPARRWCARAARSISGKAPRRWRAPSATCAASPRRARFTGSRGWSAGARRRRRRAGAAGRGRARRAGRPSPAARRDPAASAMASRGARRSPRPPAGRRRRGRGSRMRSTSTPGRHGIRRRRGAGRSGRASRGARPARCRARGGRQRACRLRRDGRHPSRPPRRGAGGADRARLRGGAAGAPGR
jgi:hypothetical protein